MPNYLLLLTKRRSTFQNFPPKISRPSRRICCLGQQIEDEGKFVGGEKLKDEGGKHLVGSNGDLRVTDGPYTEAKEVIGGIFTISAAGYDEAVETASGCPHLKYGGRIELREIEATP